MMTTSSNPDSEPTAERQRLVGRETTITSEQQARELDRRTARGQTEEWLDEALRETFPASDPIAITAARKHDSE